MLLEPIRVRSLIYIICRARTKLYAKKRLFQTNVTKNAGFSRVQMETKSVLTPIFSKASTTTATSFAISRAFFALRTRCGIHTPRIVTLGLSATIGTFHLVQITFDEFVKLFPTFFALVL